MSQLVIPGRVFWMTPTEFYEESLRELKEKNILLVMSSSNAKRLSLKKWVDLIGESSSLTWIDQISSNPTYVDLFEALSVFKDEKPDLVFAIGGGSVIDLAKSCVGLSYLHSNHQFTKEAVLNAILTKEYLDHPARIPIYATPTTAGTGSEVTQWATIWDQEGGEKYSIDAPFLVPKRAYIVPEYTISMPPRLTLATGLDALCQAVEAYWARSTSPMVKELAKVAIRLLVEYLPQVLVESGDRSCREKVSLGSLFSGLAFSNTRTTACHSLSYPLTMKFGIEHGLACAISLAQVMKVNLPVIEEARELLGALGVSGVEELQEWLDETAHGIVDLRLSAFGIEEKDLPELVEASFTLGRMDNNPVALTPEMVKGIFISIL